MNISNLLSKLDCDYAEVRTEEKEATSISLSNDEIDASTGPSYGISVRILKNGSWGFSSSNRPGDLPSLLKSAERLASLSKGKIKVAECKKRSARVSLKTSLPHIEEKIDLVKEAARHAEGKYIHNRSCRLFDSLVKKEFYNSEGTEILQDSFHVYFSCTATAKDGTAQQRGQETSASGSGYKEIKFTETAKDAARKAEALLIAIPAKKGVFTVVLDPEMTGVLSHEAVGHACEADAVIDRESILRGKIGKRIGNNFVTIYDDPTAKNFGTYKFDDEGVEAKKTVLVERGILRGYINSRSTAKELGHTPNGHARAEDFESAPVVRMSNTYFMPGKASKEDVMDIRDGIYLKGMKGGSVDIFSGGFMFAAELAYEIKNGEIGKMIRDTGISGNILETLHNIELVGKDFGTSPGFCGKAGQHAPVSDGGPHIRVKKVRIG
ncbi:TPA: TldD/PmbA family protein [Candidatus Micrarchaeota archaeon]|nr:TldD/PmbA family protein [Candidatus Micrarchaeota archaeon]